MDRGGKLRKESKRGERKVSRERKIGLGGIEPPLYNPKLYALPITLQSEREREGGIGVKEFNIKRDSRLIVG